MRRVRALVEVDGKEREMEFLTNNLCWSASSAADLYRCRWQIEVFSKQIKRAPSSLPPRADRLDPCLVLGYKFRYRESILLILRKRKLQLLDPYLSMGGQKLELPLTENYRSLTRRWTSLNHKQ
jgi:hypothetical protein